MEDEGSAFGRCKNFRKDLSEGLPFHVDVSACVAHRRIQACVAEPLTDGGKVHTGLEKMDGGRVSQGMRMDALFGESRYFLGTSRYVFP